MDEELPIISKTLFNLVRNNPEDIRTSISLHYKKNMDVKEKLIRIKEESQ